MGDPSNPSNSHDPSDDIDIKEIVTIVQQQKKIIIGVFLMCLFISVAMMVATRPVYESRAVIAIGEVGQQEERNQQNQYGARRIEEPLLLVQRLQESDHPSDWAVVLSGVEIDKKAANNVIILKANGNVPEETQRFLTTIVAQIIQEHDKIYNVSLAAHQQRILSLEEQIKNSDIEIKAYRKVLNAKENINDSSSMLILLEKSKAESLKMDMEKQLTEEKSTIALQLKPTKVFSAPTLPVTPIKPKPISIAIGAMIGLLLGGVAAFVKHSMQKKSNP